MNFEHLRVPSEGLTHLTDLLLLRDENPHIYDVVAHSPSLGLFTAKMISARPIDDLEEVVTRIDEAAGAAKGSVPAMIETLGRDVMSDLLECQLFMKPLTGVLTSISNSYPEEQLEAVSDIAIKAIPAASRTLLERMESYGTDALLVAANFLSSGDLEARRQVLISYPMATYRLLSDPEFRAAVDKREEIAPILSTHLGLDAAAMRIFTRFERAISDLCYEEGNEKGSAIPMGIADKYGRSDGNRVGRRLVGLHHVRDTAIQASSRMKLEQLLDGRDLKSHMDTLFALRAFSIAEGGAGITSLGPAPFDRVLQRVKPGEWGEVSGRLSQQLFKLADLHDYSRATVTKIVSAILVERFRQDPWIDMDLLSDTAHKVLSDEEVDPAAAEALGTFLTALNQNSYLVQQTSVTFARIVGDRASLKAVSEANARWHHIQGRIDNELMATSENLEWDPMLGEVDLDGVRARELTSSEALIAQGRRENHCVGSYSRQVLGANRGDITLLFSIEDPAGDILSTAEITAKLVQIDARTNSYSWSCPQHQARSNTPPSTRAQEAVRQLLTRLDQLPQSTVGAYVNRIVHDHQNLKDSLARSINVFGANICDPGLPERTVETIASTLPKRLRNASIDEWRQLLEDQFKYINPIQKIGDTVALAMYKIQSEMEPAGQ